jgi:hypothetical protein
MERSSRQALSLICLAMLASTGCSLAFVNAPPEASLPAGRTVDCTTSRAAPVADTVGGSAALGFLALGIYLAANPCSPPAMTMPPPYPGYTAPCESAPNVFMGGLTAAIGGISAIVYAVSAWRGYTHTARCRALQERAPGAPARAPITLDEAVRARPDGG